LVKKESEEDIIKRGKAVEQVTNMPGWREYIAPLIVGVRNAATANIINVDAEKDEAVRVILLNKGAINVLNGLMNRINEWVKKKNKILEVQAKRSEKNKKEV